MTEEAPVPGHPINILLVEDSLADIRLTRECLLSAKIANTLHVVNNGEEALEFLHQRGPYAGRPRPDVILLDLNMPVMDGRETLALIKQDEMLRRIPVVVLTSSRSDEDVFKSYDLHANCYIVKPINFAQFLQAIHSIENFWLSVVVLPEV